MFIYIVSYVSSKGIKDPNSSGAQAGANILIGNIEDTRKMVSSLNLAKEIPVGNSDAGSFFSTKVLESVDYGVSILVFIFLANSPNTH